MVKFKVDITLILQSLIKSLTENVYSVSAVKELWKACEKFTNNESTTNKAIIVRTQVL